MKVLILWLTIVTATIVGCSQPDGGDVADLENEIAAMPKDQFDPLSAWVFRNVVDKYLSDHGDQDGGDLTCYDAAGGVAYTSTLILDEWLACFRGPSRPSWDKAGWDACTERIRDSYVGVIFNGVRVARCVLNLKPTVSWEQVVDGAAGENQDRINRAWISLMATTLISSPVAPPVTISRLLPYLCGLGAGWGCPGAPDHPGSAPVIDSVPPGGDR